MTPGSLVVPPHGNGLIKQGGNPGNAGGPGRPANVVREVMRGHLDLTMIDAVLEEWRGGRTTALQVAEFFAKHALPAQGETLNAEQEARGKILIAATIGRLIDILRADGRYTDQELDARHTLATEGLG